MRTGANRYRFGFNGKEKDDETYLAGNEYDYGFRIYNPRLARFLSIDPLFRGFSYYTPYQFAGNQPVWATDLDGLEQRIIHLEVQRNRWDEYQGALLKPIKAFDIDDSKNIQDGRKQYYYYIRKKDGLHFIGTSQKMDIGDNTNWHYIFNKPNQPRKRTDKRVEDKIAGDQFNTEVVNKSSEQTTKEKVNKTVNNIGDGADVTEAFSALAGAAKLAKGVSVVGAVADVTQLATSEGTKGDYVDAGASLGIFVLGVFQPAAGAFFALSKVVAGDAIKDGVNGKSPVRIDLSESDNKCSFCH